MTPCMDSPFKNHPNRIREESRVMTLDLSNPYLCSNRISNNTKIASDSELRNGNSEGALNEGVWWKVETVRQCK